MSSIGTAKVLSHCKAVTYCRFQRIWLLLLSQKRGQTADWEFYQEKKLFQESQSNPRVMHVRNSIFKNGKDIPEVKPQEIQAGSQKDVELLGQLRLLLRKKQAALTVCARELVPQRWLCFQQFLSSYRKLLVTVNQISLQQLVIKLAVPMSLRRRGRRKIKCT